MAELPEIRLGTQLIYQVAVGEYLMGWNELSSSVPPTPPTGNVVANFITASGITDSTQISAVTILYNELSASALLDKIDVIYPFVGGNATAHSYNLLDTGSYTLNFTGSWTHNSNGITGDGSTTSADTSYIPTTDNTSFTSSGSLGIYSLTEGGSGYDMGAEFNTAFSPRQSGIIARYTANDDYYAGTPIASYMQYQGGLNTGAGMYIASTQTLESIGSIDGQIVISGSVTDYYNANNSFYIGALHSKANTADELANRTYALAFIGNGLEEADHSTIYNIVQTYQTALSREVVPILPTNTRLTYLDADNASSYPGSGTDWTDLDGNHDVTLEGGYSYSSSPVGNIDLNGSTGRGTFSPDFNLGEFTLSTWFRMDVDGLNTIVGEVDLVTQPAKEKILFNTTGLLQFRAREAESSVLMDVGFDTGSMLGEWHMVTVKRDSSNNVYSVLDNGTWVTGSIPITGSFNFNTIGDNANNDQNFDGAFSNMMIYTSSLSDAEVSQIYQHFNPNF
jgi:hypothetical protein